MLKYFLLTCKVPPILQLEEGPRGGLNGVGVHEEVRVVDADKIFQVLRRIQEEGKADIFVRERVVEGCDPPRPELVHLRGEFL